MESELVVVKEDTAEAPAAPAPKRPRRRVEITIFDRWCKGCGLCSTFCPTHTIEADEEGRPKGIHTERCTVCQWCVIHCPDLAITIRALDSQGNRQ